MESFFEIWKYILQTIALLQPTEEGAERRARRRRYRFIKRIRRARDKGRISQEEYEEYLSDYDNHH